MINRKAVHIEKKNARQIYKQLRRELSDKERTSLDSKLYFNTVNCQAFISADTVLCYYPVKGEPNILPIVEQALKLGKKVAFPISHIESRELTFHLISNLSELREGTYGIPEPQAKFPSPTELKNSVCLVPALAFDKKGKRLGYGGGYYDRFLSDFEGISIGLAYHRFFVDSIPADEYDATVKLIITEKGEVFFCE